MFAVRFVAEQQLRAAALIAAAVLLAGPTLACSPLPQSDISGASARRVAGASVVRQRPSTARNTLHAAAVGGSVGAAITRRMDQQAKELQRNISMAAVERVAEGIHLTFPASLLFDFDSDRLRDEAKAALASLASSLAKYPGTLVLVVGHSEHAGSESVNRVLSERRALTTRSYLTSMGVDYHRVRSSGVGGTEPLAPNDSEAGRLRNRRIEVAIYSGESVRVER